MLKIKKNDEVVVIAGRDKGKRGDVLNVLKDGRLMVSGVNMVKKHSNILMHHCLVKTVGWRSSIWEVKPSPVF